MNKRAMLGNLIGGFIVLLIGISLLGSIGAEVEEALAGKYCPVDLTNKSIKVLAPEGETDSFGGAGGEYTFGGYDGEVKHRNFNPIQKHKQAQSQCSAFGALNDSNSSAAVTMIKMVPAFFALSVILVSITIVFNTLRSAGLLSGVGEL